MVIKRGYKRVRIKTKRRFLYAQLYTIADALSLTARSCPTAIVCSRSRALWTNVFFLSEFSTWYSGMTKLSTTINFTCNNNLHEMIINFNEPMRVITITIAYCIQKKN